MDKTAKVSDEVTKRACGIPPGFRGFAVEAESSSCITVRIEAKVHFARRRLGFALTRARSHTYS